MNTKSIWDIDDDASGSSSSDDVTIRYSELVISVKPIKLFKEVSLHPAVLAALYKLKFIPRKVQSYLLPLLLENNQEKHNVVIHGEKNYGKTTSVLLAILSCLHVSGNKSSQAIIICPTLEFAEDTLTMVKNFIQFGNKPISCRIVARKQKTNKGQKVEERIVIGTPEKIVNIINNGCIDLKNVEMIVLDDIQLMLNNKGHKDSMLKIFLLAPVASQFTFISSATSSKETIDSILKITPRKFCPLSIQFPVTQHDSSQIKMYFISLDDSKMKEYLETVVHTRSFGKIAIVCSTKDTVVQVYNDLTERWQNAKLQISLGMLHGKLSKSQRDSIIKDFTIGNMRILITTQGFTNIKTQALWTIINYNHFLSNNSQDFELNLDHYKNWIDVLAYDRKSIMINFVEERDAKFLLEKEIKLANAQIVDYNKLTTKLLGMNAQYAPNHMF